MSDAPEVRIRLDRVVPIGDRFVPYLWVADDSIQVIEATLRADPSVDAVSVIDRIDNRVLVRIDWAEPVDGLLEAMADVGATILEGVGEEDGWQLRLRFDDHSQLSAFFRRCADQDIELDLETIHSPAAVNPGQPTPNLTEPQRQALELAIEAGYFDVPRRTNLVELADQMDISDSAASQRIRRGIRTVLDETAFLLDRDQTG